MIPRQVFQLRAKNFKSIITSSWKFSTRHGNMDEKPVEKSIREKITTALSPIHLEVINESYMHNVPKGSETHFKVVVVSKEFENVPLIGRHRTINSLLDPELKNGVHALSIVAKAPSQWSSSEEVKPSPKCLGGFGK